MTSPAFRRPDLTHLSFQSVSGRHPTVFTNTDRLMAFRDALLRIKPPEFGNNIFVFNREKK